MTQQQFIESLIPYTNGLVVLPSLFLSQVCKESGFGKHIFYNNMLGIKCHDSKAYAGCRIGKTGEVINGVLNPNMKLSFQCYNDPGECAEDYNHILSYVTKWGFDRYKPVRNSKCYQEATYYIKKCGYATGLNYDVSLRDDYIIPFKLYNYDYRKPYESKITKNFTYSECFSTSVVGSNYFKRAVEPEVKYDNDVFITFVNAQIVRDRLNEVYGNNLKIGSRNSNNEIVVIVGSFWRTSEFQLYLYRTKQTTATTGDHVIGKAIDLYTPYGMTPAQFLAFIKECNTQFNWFKLYSWGVHCSRR